MSTIFLTVSEISGQTFRLVWRGVGSYERKRNLIDGQCCLAQPRYRPIAVRPSDVRLLIINLGVSLCACVARPEMSVLVNLHPPEVVVTVAEKRSIDLAGQMSTKPHTHTHNAHLASL